MLRKSCTLNVDFAQIKIMKAQSDAYPPGGFWQIVRNMQSRICHKN
jgi:hypothetical protein